MKQGYLTNADVQEIEDWRKTTNRKINPKYHKIKSKYVTCPNCKFEWCYQTIRCPICEKDV